MKSTHNRLTYKPHPKDLEEFIHICLTQQQMHWIHTEIDMLEDCADFWGELDQNEQNIITQTLRFFTQSDVEVARCYIDYYLQVFKSPEVRMMLISFANMEAIHVLSYAFLNTSLKLPDSDFAEFIQYKEMADKYNYMQQFNINDPKGIATTLAIVSGFIEGLSLFSSFTILLYFSAKRNEYKKGCLRGLGQIISFSIRDETLHCLSIIKLFKLYMKENNLKLEDIEEQVRENCKKVVELEIAYIDLIFKNGDLPGLSKEELKLHIYYLANIRLNQLGFSSMFEGKFLDWTKNFLYPKQLANFFESFETNYAKGAFENDISWDTIITN